jgi:hypothetical protein
MSGLRLTLPDLRRVVVVDASGSGEDISMLEFRAGIGLLAMICNCKWLVVLRGWTRKDYFCVFGDANAGEDVCPLDAIKCLCGHYSAHSQSGVWMWETYCDRCEEKRSEKILVRSRCSKTELDLALIILAMQHGTWLRIVAESCLVMHGPLNL